MDINNILEKEEISQDEMEFLIEEYIFAKKGKRIKVTPFLPFELGLLQNAFWGT